MSAVFLKIIRKRGDDSCWFCQLERQQQMTRSHTLLYCSNVRLVEARREVFENKSPGSLMVLLSSPRRERRLLKFLEQNK